LSVLSSGCTRLQSFLNTTPMFVIMMCCILHVFGLSVIMHLLFDCVCLSLVCIVELLACSVC
jgi:hypothetical protein